MLAASKLQIEWDNHHRRWQQDRSKLAQAEKQRTDAINKRLIEEAKAARNLELEAEAKRQFQQAQHMDVKEDKDATPVAKGFSITLGGQEYEYRPSATQASFPHKINWDSSLPSTTIPHPQNLQTALACKIDTYEQKEQKQELSIAVEAASPALLSVPVTPTSASPSSMSLEEDTTPSHFKPREQHPAKRARTVEPDTDSDSESFVKLSEKDFDEKEHKT